MADGSRIRELRTRRGFLQRELAEMAGVTESAVRNYELGLRTPRPQHLEALARALGVDPAALTDYGLETSRDALEVLFRLEEGFGARPEADDSGARVVVDPRRPAPRSPMRRSGHGPRCARDGTPGRSPRRSTSTGSAGSAEGRFWRLRGHSLLNRNNTVP